MQELKIAKVREETHDVSTFFVRPQAEGLDWKPKAGQYITIEVEVKGESLRRSYSLCSAPYEEDLAFSIKRVEKGRVSNYMLDNMKEGSTLKMLGPDGKFVLLPDVESRKDYYFFAAGSGITPVMAMIKTVLEQEPKSTAYLLYGNRSEDDIIFKDELDLMSSEYKDQLLISYTLSQPKKEKKGGIGGFFSKGTVNWKGWKGRIDETMIHKFLELYPTRSRKNEFYICGPGNFINYTEQVLTLAGHDKKTIKKEYFSSPDDAQKAAPAIGGKAKIKVTLEGETFELDHDNEKTILETIVDAGKNPPYSCTAGACSTCIAKTISGKVSMDTCFALDDDEINDGYILTCQSRAESAEIEIEYEE